MTLIRHPINCCDGDGWGDIFQAKIPLLIQHAHQRRLELMRYTSGKGLAFLMIMLMNVLGVV